MMNKDIRAHKPWRRRPWPMHPDDMRALYGLPHSSVQPLITFQEQLRESVKSAKHACRADIQPMAVFYDPWKDVFNAHWQW